MALGAAAWLVAAPHLGLPAASPSCLGLAVLGALLPDIDHPKSWLGRRVRPVSSGIAAVLGHRGVTHSAWAAAVCAWGLHGGALRWVAAPLAVGYLSHLAADLLTPRGLRLAWPLRATWACPLCKTGSPFEPLVVALALFWAGSGTLVPPLLQEAWVCSPASPRKPTTTARRTTERQSALGGRNLCPAPALFLRHGMRRHRTKRPVEIPFTVRPRQREATYPPFKADTTRQFSKETLS